MLRGVLLLVAAAACAAAIAPPVDAADATATAPSSLLSFDEFRARHNRSYAPGSLEYAARRVHFEVRRTERSRASVDGLRHCQGAFPIGVTLFASTHFVSSHFVPLFYFIVVHGLPPSAMWQ